MCCLRGLVFNNGFITSIKEMMFLALSSCLSVCKITQNLLTDFDIDFKLFRKCPQWQKEQMTNTILV